MVISDLHLGIEGALRSEGVSLPRYQKKIIIKNINKILERYNPEKLVINGDFKHEFGRNLRQEWREISDTLGMLSKKTNVILIRGNHDNFLKTISSKFNIPVNSSYLIDDILITHGHMEVKENFEFKKQIIAHEHPFIRLRDRIGAKLSLPCYLVSEDLAVTPAFSPLASGTDVIASEKNEYLSPVLKKYDIKKMRVWAITEAGLLDFSTIENLQKMV